jgi:hypothetical protein
LPLYIIPRLIPIKFETLKPPVAGSTRERDKDLGEGHRGAEEGDQGAGHHRPQQGEREGRNSSNQKQNVRIWDS